MAMDDLINGKPSDPSKMLDRQPSEGQVTPKDDSDDAMRSPVGMSSPTTPAGNNLSPGGRPHDMSKDLSVELLQQGWRKFFSNRENQYYYYNKITAQSLWEPPPLPGQPQMVPHNDPLGISSPVGASPPSRDPHDIRISRQSIDIPCPGPMLKRRRSEEVTAAPAKRPIPNFVPSWNFNVASNVHIMERPPLKFLPPHPEVELLRSQYMDKLRKQYEDLCMSREEISAPPSSFNRWMLERKVIDQGDDPVFPSICNPEVSQSMFREIMNDIPIRLSMPKYTTDARRQLSMYGDAAKKMLGRKNVSATARKMVKWKVDETFAWLRKEETKYAQLDELQRRLAHLKRYCQPYLTEAAKESVDGICAKIQHLSTDYATKIKEKHLSLLKEVGLTPTEHLPTPRDRRVRCYPAQHYLPPHRLPVLEHCNEKDVTSVTFNGETHTLKLQYMMKLEQLYQHNCEDGQKFDYFLPRVWCLLRRYQSFFGPDPEEGAHQQGALPVSVFECLNRVFGVTFECFASPFNCYFRQYCSAFADTDCYFGCRGTLLEFKPLTGSFEANPPFSDELMLNMVDHFESLLEETKEPLSFIVFIPEWRDPPPEALLRMESSKWNQKQITLDRHEHEYRHGYQHKTSVKDANLHIKSGRGTCVFFLQNDAGFEKWGPTEDRIKELVVSALPKDHIKHRHLSGSEHDVR